MIWSPSRILNNFLVYREVEKKDPKPAPDQPAFVTSHSGFPMQTGDFNGGGSSHAVQHASIRSVPLSLMPNASDADGQVVHYKQDHSGYHTLDGASTSSNTIYTEHNSFFGNYSHQHHHSAARSHAQAAGMVGLLEESETSASTSKREAELDRTIVGSLTSSYPFVRDGLCKKTISIQVEGSTQHLISYYKIDDVHNQRLTIPSNLPEIASLPISPLFLNKSNFRYPPIVECGPDGLLKYVGESTDNALRTPGHISSGNESYSSGSEARHDGFGRAVSRSLSLYSPLPTDHASVELYSHRHPHQIGGDGMLPSSATLPSSTSSGGYRSRRSSDAPRRRANSRYEPYQPQPAIGHGMVTSQFYPNSPSGDNDPASPSGRRGMFTSTRGYNEVDALQNSEQVSFPMPRQDGGYFALEQVGHASGQGSVVHAGHLSQQHSSIEPIEQHSGLQQPFQAASLIPIVPSQLGRNHAGYPTGADFMHGRSDAVVMKQEHDPFHFSSRLTRGSWDSNQPIHSNHFGHHIQQPPATSQGLTAIPAQSQSNFGGPVYGRFAGSPPNTSSSHDSRHSFIGSGGTHATGRIEELVDGVHPPTATRLEDANYPSRTMSRAGEGGYVGDLDSAGVVRAGAMEALHVHSVPTSPYPQTHQHQQHQQPRQLGNDTSEFDAYSRAAGGADVQTPIYPQQAQPAQLQHANVQVEQQGLGQHAADDYAPPQPYASTELGSAPTNNEQTWSSDPMPESNGADPSFSSRSGTSQDQGYPQQFHAEAGNANPQESSGLERVMLTRPTS